MRRKTLFFIFFSLLLWVVVTLFLVYYETKDSAQEKLDLDEITRLENEVNQLIKENEELINRLEQIRSKQKSILTEESSKISPTLTNITLLDKESPVIAVLVISCNRITVQRCLDQLLRYRPNAKQFPIIVSQDCGHEQTTKVIKSYGSSVYHIRQPDQTDIDVPLKERKFKGYFKISRHYGWALNHVFFKLGFNSAIVVEDDLDVAPDFFEYFSALHPILESDPALWCISGWNDNGKPELIDINSPHLLYRTDFFPGLGWMLTKTLWEELSPKWPKSYWDDWIRQPEQRKNRACIRPEVPRTRTFGKVGVSNGMFYEKHLKYIKLNEKFVPFTKMNLSYLHKDNYDKNFLKQVYDSKVVSYYDLKSGINNTQESVRIPYHTRQAYKSSARILGLMDDFKSGVPRTGYLGVVTFFYKGKRAYLAPSTSWTGYDVSWS